MTTETLQQASFNPLPFQMTPQQAQAWVLGGKELGELTDAEIKAGKERAQQLFGEVNGRLDKAETAKELSGGLDFCHVQYFLELFNPSSIREARGACHKFEIAGLGKYPFTCVGVEAKVYVACPGATPQPAGTCAYCGNGIKYCFEIVARDGKRFVVGSECVNKTDDAGLKKQAKAKKSGLDRVIKAKAEGERIDAAHELIKRADIIAHLKALPHPNEYHASKGKTKFDYYAWMMENASHTGRFNTTKGLELIASSLDK